MKFRGSWNSTSDYLIGDAVVYADDHVYHKTRPCPTGTTPIDTRYWQRLGQEAEQVLVMVVDMFEDLFARIPSNINEESIVLKGTDDAEYIITVDDSGETPELAVDPIPEGDGN